MSQIPILVLTVVCQPWDCYIPKVVRDPADMLLECRTGGTLCMPANQHLDYFGYLQK